MKAFVIAQINVTDPDQYRLYTEQVPATIAQFGGRSIARGGQCAVLEGPDDIGRVVILEFPSLAQAQAWYNSPEYQRVKALRDGAAVVRIVAVEGSE
jgi:uncharacterized protein (DUF1330 family)